MVKKPHLYIFAGAGLSAGSGLATFRASDGLWASHDVREVCDFEQFLADSDAADPKPRQRTFAFYSERKKEILAAQPNEAHLRISDWQQKWGADRVHVVTSNIDDLLERAGCRGVVHLHGDIYHMQCASCGHTWPIGEEAFDANELCPECASHLTKPNIVFFGETAPEYQSMYQVFDAKKRTRNDVLLWVGSSMQVLTPSRVFQLQGGWGEPSLGFKVLLDPQADVLARQAPVFDLVLKGAAETHIGLVTSLLHHFDR